MAPSYGEAHRALQDEFQSRRLADRLNEIIVHQELTDEERQFIESRDMFFLATVDQDGHPTCSYKGGDPGFIRAVDSRTLAFPCYDGNGMFFSAGNIRGQGDVGLLFIDFESPNRLRVHGTATVSDDDPLLARHHEAQLMVRIAIREIFINCGRYIHRYQKLERSPYAPVAGCPTPVPDWKRLPVVEDVLPPADRAKVAADAG